MAVHCFLLNEDLRKRSFNGCTEDSPCSLPVSVNLSESHLDWVITSYLISDIHLYECWLTTPHLPTDLPPQRDLSAFWLRCTYISIKLFIIIFKTKSPHLKLGSWYCVLCLMGTVLVLITYLIAVLFPVWERELPFRWGSAILGHYDAMALGSLRNDGSHVLKLPVLTGWVLKDCKGMKNWWRINTL